MKFLDKLGYIAIGIALTILGFRGYFYDYFDNMPKEMIRVAYFSYLVGCLQDKPQPIFEYQKRTCIFKAEQYRDSLAKALGENNTP